MKTVTEWVTPLTKGMVKDIKAYLYDRSGGFQGHVKETWKRINDGVLTWDDTYIGRTWRHAYIYTSGGWNKLCQRLLARMTFHHTKVES